MKDNSAYVSIVLFHIYGMQTILASFSKGHNPPTPDNLVGGLTRERENSKYFSWKLELFSLRKYPGTYNGSMKLNVCI